MYREFRAPFTSHNSTPIFCRIQSHSFKLAPCAEHLSVNLACKGPRLPGREWDSPRRCFFSNMTDTLEQSTRHRASHHWCWTDQHLQAPGGGLGRFLKILVTLKSLSLTWRLYSVTGTGKTMTNQHQNPQEMDTNYKSAVLHWGGNGALAL